MTGLHCAHELKKRMPHRSIAIYERSAYLGGRICTKRHDQYVIGYAAPNYEPGKHGRFMSLLADLNVETEHVSSSQFVAIAPNFSRMLPDEVRLFDKEMCENGILPNVLMLSMYGIGKIFDHNNIVSPREVPTEDLKKIVRTTCTYNHVLLNRSGILDIFIDVFSVESLQFMRQCEGQFGVIASNPLASEFICQVFCKFAVFKWDVCSVGGGFNAIIERLTDRLSGLVDVRCRNTLVGIEPFPPNDIGRTYRLVFDTGAKVSCDHLILTTPPEKLREIDGVPNRILATIGTSLKRIDLFKTFVLLENPPWKKGKVELMTDVEQPRREDADADGDVLGFPKDDPNRKHETAILLRNNVSRMLNLAYPRETSGWRIKVIEMSGWYKKPATHAYVWRPGLDIGRVLDELSAFSLDASSKKHVHLCGETFSRHPCFMEGAISSAEDVVRRVVA